MHYFMLLFDAPSTSIVSVFAMKICKIVSNRYSLLGFVYGGGGGVSADCYMTPPTIFNVESLSDDEEN
jgi:hypothetical protein